MERDWLKQEITMDECRQAFLIVNGEDQEEEWNRIPQYRKEEILEEARAIIRKHFEEKQSNKLT